MMYITIMPDSFNVHGIDLHAKAEEITDILILMGIDTETDISDDKYMVSGKGNGDALYKAILELTRSFTFFIA